MSEYFDARTEIGKAFNDPNYQGNLNRTDIENLEQDESLFHDLIRQGEKFTLSEKDSNGNFKEISEQDFKKFINNIAQEYGISLSDVADDAEVMFKVLDANGDGILEDSELKILKNSDKRNSADDIDGYTVGRYFKDMNHKALQSELKIADDIETVKSGTDRDIKFLEIKYKNDPETLAYIKEKAEENNAPSPVPSYTLDNEQIENLAQLYNAENTDAEIKAEILQYFPEMSTAELDDTVKGIRNLIGTKNVYGTNGEYTITQKTIDGEKETKKTFYNGDGTPDYAYEYQYNDDGSYTKTTIHYDTDGTEKNKTVEKYDKNNNLIPDA